MRLSLAPVLLAVLLATCRPLPAAPRDPVPPPPAVLYVPWWVPGEPDYLVLRYLHRGGDRYEPDPGYRRRMPRKAMRFSWRVSRDPRSGKVVRWPLLLNPPR
jgi:hypothetical protein